MCWTSKGKHTCLLTSIIIVNTYPDWHLHEHLLGTTGENSPRCMNLDISCLSITGGLSLKKHIHLSYATNNITIYLV